VVGSGQIETHLFSDDFDGVRVRVGLSEEVFEQWIRVVGQSFVIDPGSELFERWERT
jgi:hypothetical protein